MMISFGIFRQVLKYSIIIVLVIDVFLDTNVLLSSDKNIFNQRNVVSCLLIISLVFSNRLTSVVLLLYVLDFIYLFFYFNEYAFFDSILAIGNSFDSYLHLHKLGSLIIYKLSGNISAIICLFILFLELPNRYKTYFKRFRTKASMKK